MPLSRAQARLERGLSSGPDIGWMLGDGNRAQFCVLLHNSPSDLAIFPRVFGAHFCAAAELTFGSGGVCLGRYVVEVGAHGCVAGGWSRILSGCSSQQMLLKEGGRDCSSEGGLACRRW